jgi:hypothetical protein|tara:strand:+ start:10220 stop:10624 length:405 start_codon:yes stop_codon:yes gene_type:complete
MIKINRYKYRIEDSDQKLAEENNWNDTENTYIGNLGEIAVSKYLDLNEWTVVEKAVSDIIDDEGNRIQVKSTKNSFAKKRFWLEQKENLEFDRYIFCLIDEEEKFATVEADMLTEIAHSNFHIYKNLKAIYRRK